MAFKCTCANKVHITHIEAPHRFVCVYKCVFLIIVTKTAHDEVGNETFTTPTAHDLS